MEIITGDYDTKLSASISSLAKCGNYRDTGVSKNVMWKESVEYKSMHQYTETRWCLTHNYRSYMPKNNLFISTQNTAD